MTRKGTWTCASSSTFAVTLPTGGRKVWEYMPIQTIITTLAGFGTRHTASSQTDPNRGIGAAIAYVTGLMQDIAATSGGRMTVQQQPFTQPPGSTLAAATSITNIIATLKGTASPERFYVVTGHLDSRCTNILDSTSDAPGADDDASGVAVAHTRRSVTRRSG